MLEGWYAVGPARTDGEGSAFRGRVRSSQLGETGEDRPGMGPAGALTSEALGEAAEGESDL